MFAADAFSGFVISGIKPVAKKRKVCYNEAMAILRK